MHNNYPHNLVRGIYGSSKTDNSDVETTYYKGLFEVLRTLTVDEQLYIKKHYEQGLSRKMIADNLNVTLYQVNKEINKAFRKLRGSLRKKDIQAVSLRELEAVKADRERIREQNEAYKKAFLTVREKEVDALQLLALLELLDVKMLYLPIENLNLKPTTFSKLKRAGVETVKDLLQTPTKELKNLRNVGAKSFDEIQAELRAYILFPDTYSGNGRDST